MRIASPDPEPAATHSDTVGQEMLLATIAGNGVHAPGHPMKPSGCGFVQLGGGALTNCQDCAPFAGSVETASISSPTATHSSTDGQETAVARTGIPWGRTAILEGLDQCNPASAFGAAASRARQTIEAAAATRDHLTRGDLTAGNTSTRLPTCVRVSRRVGLSPITTLPALPDVRVRPPMARAETTASAPRRSAATPRRSRLPVVWLLWLAAAGNGAVVIWLWVHGGGLSLAGTLGGLLTSLGRLTALVGTYLVLLQVMMLARIPWLERSVGFDRLTVWHRRNGKAAIILVVAHVPLIVAGYAMEVQISLGEQIDELYGYYPGMVTATIGTGLLIAVVVSSLGAIRRRVPYEAWYALHLSVYAGILLSYFHQIPTGNEFTANAVQRDYWYALYIVTILVLIAFRVVAPVFHWWRYRLRVTAVRRESPDVVSVYIDGRNLERLGARGGQFFLWRFLSRGRWWQAHPFSLSAPPDGSSLRITVKDVGGFSGRLGKLRPGTAVIAEGPFGTFTPALADGADVALIAGGIGITPLRAMLDELLRRGREVTVIHRVLHERDLVLGAEIAEIAGAGGATVVNVVGDHESPEGAALLSGEHLKRLIPDIAAREVFLCGPPGMMRHVRAGLRAEGVPRRSIHSERFALAA